MGAHRRVWARVDAYWHVSARIGARRRVLARVLARVGAYGRVLTRIGAYGRASVPKRTKLRLTRVVSIDFVSFETDWERIGTYWRAYWRVLARVGAYGRVWARIDPKTVWAPSI